MSRLPAQLEPPGEIIREELEARGWTQSDLAEVMGRPIAAVNEIVNGKRKITVKTAGELEAAFGVSARFWMNLETAYQLSLSRNNDSARERAKVLEYAPIKEMQRRGWLPKAHAVGELRDAVLAFFSVSSLDDPPELAGAFRTSAEVSTAHIAWCIKAMEQARLQSAKPFRASQANELQQALREMAAYAEEIRRVPMVLADFGIRFVVVKHLQSTKIDGATLWLDRKQQTRPVIAMSLRYGRVDSFWHTLCHELSHVLHRDSFRIDRELDKVREDDGDDEIEQRANEEAAAMLIPPNELRSFILRKHPYFSAKSIIQFAHKVKIHPGIIVGQLQYRNAIQYTHSQKMLVQIRENILETSVSDGWSR